MQRDLRPQLRTIAICTATLVAMIATDWLRVVGLQGVPVAAFCLGSSAVLGLMLILEPIVEERRRLRLARQTAQTLRQDGRRHDDDDRGDGEQR
jgi:hypothetical protein